MSDRVFVVSCDGHAAPPTAEYRPYLDKQYRDAFDEYLSVHHHRFTPGHADSVLDFSILDSWKGQECFEHGGHDGVSNASRRLDELDCDGVAVELIFPDDTSFNAQPFCSGLESAALERVWSSELKQAAARAHNRWLADFCAGSSQRLRGLTALGALEDVDTAVDEVRRAYRSGLRTGIVLPLDYYLPLYHHPRYEPLWRVCVELGLPVIIHGSDGNATWLGDADRAGPAVFLIEATFFSRRPLWCLIFGGVLDRYPELNVVFTEQRSDWIPSTLEQLDQLATRKSLRFATENPLPLLPSEYWQRQCYVCDSLMRTGDEIDAAGTQNLLFGSDYPHIEGIWPRVRATMGALVSGRGEAVIRAFLGGRAAQLFSIDAGSFEELVERIGPELSVLASASADVGMGNGFFSSLIDP